MVVVPAGAFQMGSPDGQASGWFANERPRHRVTIARPFAVSKFEVTFDEWDACVLLGGCDHRPADQDWGRGTRPAIDVDWDDAQQYVAWLARRDEQYAYAFENPKVIRAAIDRSHVRADAKIAGASEIAFFPPMTGG